MVEQDRLVAGVGDQVVVGGALLEAVDVEHLVEHLPWVDKIPEALVAAVLPEGHYGAMDHY